MKKNNTTILIIFSILLSNIFYSCNPAKVGFFNNSTPLYSAKEKKEEGAGSEKEKNFTQAAASSSQPVFASETVQKNIPLVKKNELSEISTEKISIKKEFDKKLSKEEKKEIKKFIKDNLKQAKNNETEINTLLLVIIAILLPPVAVALVDGITGPFWLSILLTLLFYLPGLIYALYRIFRER